MKNKKIYYLVGITFVLFLATFIVWNNATTEYPDDFNFTYAFGANGKESIDTYTNTLKYDSVDGLLEIKFKLSKEEKNRIYSKMVENEFMRLPQSFPILFKGDSNPVGRSYLKVEFSGDNNHVNWGTNNVDPTNLNDPTHGNRDLAAVTEIGTLIEQIISERTKSMDLPDKPGYL